ncbi:hypothetical protein I5G80_gp036 [Mycobacterium phage Krueger]|uniref:Uncharacterized protein n=1 Tax=Mycobacterium phage Krueger TaxID=2015820 RepID=A0A222ZLD4_9CAUD|nr:hypothetical protein I5G80_gp036 [Mycobacterium phage Krueger]ASR85537.1 hypothetical protein SEA_KRUEGER_36 [Mycobacterium phage Krueger]
MMRCADKAWLALAAGVVAYEVSAPRGELLSEGVDRYLTRRKWTTHAVVVGLALHLLNLIPERIDPLTQLAHATRGRN